MKEAREGLKQLEAADDDTNGIMLRHAINIESIKRQAEKEQSSLAREGKAQNDVIEVKMMNQKVQGDGLSESFSVLDLEKDHQMQRTSNAKTINQLY